MEEIDTRLSTKGLREVSWDGCIGFTVKAKDTDCNQQTHNRFRSFCNDNTEGNYTLGLKQLLEIVDSDYKYQSLFEMIMDLQDEIAIIKTKLEDKKTEKKEVEHNAF